MNLALLIFTLAQIRPAVAEGVPPVLRGRALEIVDERGRVRASVNVLPAGTQPNGETYAETVLLRLITERGRPSVKIGASEQAAGMSLAGPTNTKDTYVILEAKGTAIQFDWMAFQRDAAPFPLPNAADPDVNPPQEIFLTPAGGAEQQLTHLGLRPAGANWNREATLLAFTADSGYRNEMRYGRSDIWTVGVDGRITRLTSGTDFSYAGARYSPDGKWLLATRSTPTDAVLAKKMDNGGPVDIVVLGF